MKGICAVAFLLAALSGCSKEIGDSCTTNVDCAQDGTRICDVSQPDGYCTVDGCDAQSCPSESVCVRFFPDNFSTGPCPSGSSTECLASEICLPQQVCVPLASERRFCAVKCGDDGDCRSGYTCRTSGERGSIALLQDPNGTANFCAPR